MRSDAALIRGTIVTHMRHDRDTNEAGPMQLKLNNQLETLLWKQTIRRKTNKRNENYCRRKTFFYLISAIYTQARQKQ